MSARGVVIRFAGWFGCRLATNPDPADEPRGVGGFTFAFGDEPDLDAGRIVFQQGDFQRPYGPPIGVFVTEVETAGRLNAPEPSVSWLGAPVALLHAARFVREQRFIELGLRAAIDPFHLQISTPNGRVRRAARWHREAADIPLEHMPREARRAALSRRGGHQPRIGEAGRALLREVTGVDDPLSYRATRLATLRRALGNSDLTEGGRVALVARVDELVRSAGRPLDRRNVRLATGLDYAFELDAPELELPSELAPWICPSSPWTIRFTLGVFDADALVGYVRGELELPERVEAPN